MLNGDTAVMLLFDTNGKIAGIQNGVRKLRALLTTPTLRKFGFIKRVDKC